MSRWSRSILWIALSSRSSRIISTIVRERVILSIADDIVIDREAHANVIDNTTRAKNEGFDISACFLADHGKFDLGLFIADAGAIVEDFIMRIMSFEILVIRYSLSVFFTANVDIWRRSRLIENLWAFVFSSGFTIKGRFLTKWTLLTRMIFFLTRLYRRKINSPLYLKRTHFSLLFTSFF